MTEILLGLGGVGVALIALTYLMDKIGIFSWTAKRIHSVLPREKSMAVKHLVGSGPYMVTIRRPQGGIDFVIIKRVHRVEFLDMVLVLPNEREVYPYYFVLDVHVVKEGE